MTWRCDPPHSFFNIASMKCQDACLPDFYSSCPLCGDGTISSP